MRIIGMKPAGTVKPTAPVKGEKPKAEKEKQNKK